MFLLAYLSFTSVGGRKRFVVANLYTPCLYTLKMTRVMLSGLTVLLHNIAESYSVMTWFADALLGAHPTNGISVEFEIRSKCAVIWFQMCSIDHNEILHTSRQCYCRNVCKISLWSAPEQTVEETIEMPVIWDAIALIMTSL